MMNTLISRYVFGPCQSNLKKNFLFFFFNVIDSVGKIVIGKVLGRHVSTTHFSDNHNDMSVTFG